MFAFYSILFAFYSILLAFYSILLTFYSALLTFYSVLLTFYTVLLAFIFSSYLDHVDDGLRSLHLDKEKSDSILSGINILCPLGRHFIP